MSGQVNGTEKGEINNAMSELLTLSEYDKQNIIEKKLDSACIEWLIGMKYLLIESSFANFSLKVIKIAL